MYCKSDNCEYYASKDGYCSCCENLLKNNDSYKKQIKKTKINDVQVNEFLKTSIHTANLSDKETCIICHNEKVKTYSKFACLCYPQVCLHCLDKIHNCPICNENKYYMLSKSQIKYLLENNCSDKSLTKIFIKIIKYNHISVGLFSVKNLVASAKDITEVYEELDKKITLDYDHANNIFSFAFDTWKIPTNLNKKPNTAHCYKAMNIFNNSYYDFWYNRFGCATMNRNLIFG